MATSSQTSSQNRQMSILDFVRPGYTLRPGQQQQLLEIEDSIHSWDVAVLQDPVGFGKSLLADTVARWLAAHDMRTNLCTPKVVLQQQYTDEFKDLPSLKGKARYSCKSKGYNSCGDYADINETHCAQCPYVKAKKDCQDNDVAILNLHSYLFASDDMYKDVLIVDEAHNLLDVLSDMYTLNIWQSENYPDNLATHGDLAVWLEGETRRFDRQLSLGGLTKPQQLKLRRKKANYLRVVDGIMKAPASFFVERTDDWHRSRKMEVLRIRPTTAQHLPHTLWPRQKVKKLILMSATINDLDVQRLGLGGRRVKYFRGASAIPADRRPFIAEGVANMAYKYQELNTPVVCKRINELAAQHVGEKGIIHTTYALTTAMKNHLTGPRYLWHTRENREEVYQQFLDSTDDVVLVACGMSEGIDLAGVAYGWQAIVKIQYPSLADKLNDKQMREEPNYFNWRTVRTIVQQYGRICRGPEDYGVTYMLDAGFKDFYRRTRNLWPDYVEITWK